MRKTIIFYGLLLLTFVLFIHSIFVSLGLIKTPVTIYAPLYNKMNVILETEINNPEDIILKINDEYNSIPKSKNVLNKSITNKVKTLDILISDDFKNKIESIVIFNDLNSFYYSDFSEFEKYKIDLAATLVHEFQHMAFFDTLVRLGRTHSAAVWINEGLSMLAEFFCGYAEPHESYITGTLSNQGVSLIEDDGDSVDYGLSLLFMRYLQERFGESFIKKIYSSSQTGTASVEEAVGVDFNTLFEDFVRMILLTGRGVTDDSRYNIPAFNHAEGTAGYGENGFCLYRLIDTVYAAYGFPQTVDLRRSYGMEVQNMKNYSFYLFKWINRPVTLLQISGTDTVGFETGAF